MPENPNYQGEVRLHYCNNDKCFPPTWFSMSQRPEPCPDCKTTSRVATPMEEHEYRHNMGQPADGLAVLFLVGDSAPQHALFGAIKEMERDIG